MIIVDTALKKREAEGNPIRVGMIGAGFMARGTANQIINSVPGMRLVAIANRHVEAARRAYAEAGVDDAISVHTAGALTDAIVQNRAAVADDAMLLCESDHVDVLLEITGAVEFGAQVAMKAIACRKDVVSMNAELEATVGHIIRHKAEQAGVMYALSDGDQPGVELNLWRFVKGIGLRPLVCGNIKGLQDPYRNPTTQKGFAEKWGQNPYMVTSFADGSKISFEQACVANATGMTIEKRGMRGGDFAGHVDELCHSGRYDVDTLRAMGGVVDYVVGTKPGPGVFVLATHDDPKQKHYLNLYKLGPGPLYSFYTPYHLCHFELPLSVARVALFRDAPLQPEGEPKVDVITLAKVDLQAGQTLDAIGGYLTYGECETHQTVHDGRLLPLGLAEGCRLKRAVPKDAAIGYDDVEVPPGRLADALRAEQDALFAPSLSALPVA